MIRRCGMNNKSGDQNPSAGPPSTLSRRQVLKRTGMVMAGLAVAGSVPIGIHSLHPSHRLQIQSLYNLFHMGHCAPTVAQTLMSTAFEDAGQIVKAAGAMAGGIGNAGAECGGLTASALFLAAMHDGKSASIPSFELLLAGHLLLHRFQQANGALFCRDISRKSGMMGCIKAIRTSPPLACSVRNVQENNPNLEEDAEKHAAWKVVLPEFDHHGFHCSHSVFQLLADTINVDKTLLDATRGFVGGLFLSGMNCCALSAAVMAIGIKTAIIEDSFLSVLKMMKLMATNDARAMANSINGFNSAINTSNRLVKWFETTFGSIECRKISQTDFSCKDSVVRFINLQQWSTCYAVCEAVAKETRKIFNCGINV